MAKKKVTLENLSGFDALELHKAKASPKAGSATEAKQTQEPAIAENPQEQEQIQISAYIPKKLHRRVKVALAGQDEHTLTSLLIKLLSDWARDQG